MNETARFVAVWSRSGGIDGEAVHASLLRQYAEPLRRYHTLQHIRRCLRDLDWARLLVPDPDAVELALWFHDVIYVPGAPDNELRSADWFQGMAQGRIAASERVRDMILSTTHRFVPADRQACFTADIDLADLACERACFVRDEALLRAERPDLDDAAYDRSVRAFLSTLSAREHVYHTEVFRSRCEEQARANLAWRLAQPVLE